MRTTTPTANWLDPEPAATDQAWLADSPLLLARESEAAPLAATLPVRAQAQRYDWPKLQAKPNYFIILLVTLVTIICAAQAWAEFVGTWVPSWPLAFWLLLTWLTASYVISRSSERLPRIGRSYAAVDKDGLKLRLLYGRRPVARRFFFVWANLLAPLWPRRYRLRWSDISQAALYTANYGLRIGTLYWMRVWDKQGYGYTALVTPDEQQARTLLRTIKQHSQLTDFSRADAATPPTNPVTRTRWHTDHRRVCVQFAFSRAAAAEFWQRPDLQPRHLSIGWRKRSTAVKAIVLALFLLLVLNYNYALSLLIWPPTKVTDSQTLVPPLHEAWHVDVPYGGDIAYHIQLVDDKIMVVNGANINLYDADDGQLLRNLQITNMFGTFADKMRLNKEERYLYYVAAKLIANSDTRYDYFLTKIDASQNLLIWQQQVSNLSDYAFDAQHDTVITTAPAADGSSVIVEAISQSNGSIVWQSHSFTTDDNPIAVAVSGDTAFVALGHKGNVLVALDTATRQTLWTKPRIASYRLLADEEQVYALVDNDVTAYKRDGEERVITKEFVWAGASTALTKDALVVSSDRFGPQVISVSKANTTKGYNFALRILRLNPATLVAAGDLLYMLKYVSDSNMGGSAADGVCIIALDAQTGTQVWQSPRFNAWFNIQPAPAIVAGNKMLYIIYGGELHAYSGAR